jgi:hypothetical protein
MIDPQVKPPIPQPGFRPNSAPSLFHTVTYWLYLATLGKTDVRLHPRPVPDKISKLLRCGAHRNMHLQETAHPLDRAVL